MKSSEKSKKQQVARDARPAPVKTAIPKTWLPDRSEEEAKLATASASQENWSSSLHEGWIRNK